MWRCLTAGWAQTRIFWDSVSHGICPSRSAYASGMDVSEVAPIEGLVAPQFAVARLTYRILGRVRVTGGTRKRPGR